MQINFRRKIIVADWQDRPSANDCSKLAVAQLELGYITSNMDDFT